MKKSVLIIISFLLFILFVGLSELSVNNQAKPWPTKIDKTKNKPIGSILNDFYKAATRDYGPPDDGLKRVGSAFPDADRSQCKGVTKSPEDLMTVNFADYVFEIPCTVKPKGSYSIGYNPDNSINFQRYSLYFGVTLGQKNYDGIWWQGDYKDRGAIGFFVNLYSNGLPVSKEPIKEWIDNAEEIHNLPNQNLIVFYNKERRRVRGFIKDKFEKGEYISISCDLYGNPDPYEIFMPFHKIGDKSICNAYWSLTDTIRVRLINVKSKNAYHFDLFYKAINTGLKEAIIKTHTN